MRNRRIPDRILKYHVCCQLAQPMHIGASMQEEGESILIHPVSGLPFVQATGIAGALRGYVEKARGEDVAQGLFGGSGEDAPECRIRVMDGIFTDPEHLKVEIRPHVRIDPHSGTVASAGGEGSRASYGQKFNREYIGTGMKFTFDLFIFTDAAGTEEDKALLLEAMAALHHHEIQFGGKKSEGCGAVDVDALWLREFDMKREGDRRAWVGEASMDRNAYQDVTGTLPQKGTSGDFLLTLSGKSENYILVNGLAMDAFGKDAPDKSNLRNANGDYVIPGSSLKGVIRSRCEMICGYLGNQYPEKAAALEQLLHETFGEASSQNASGTAGNAMFEDAVIGRAEEIERQPLLHRIHVDKFTGGVFHGANINEKAAAGEVTIRIHVHSSRAQAASTGLLLLALRDLAMGLYSLGGEYSIGRGFIQADELVLDTPEGAGVLHLNDHVGGADNRPAQECSHKELIDTCVKALDSFTTQ